ncbi:MAG: hypothetical protein HRK26_04980 [Rickettsiaceae bacterium H1]|nr:hypothetical protein [Rickettsiaceae bacterium H1]
MTTEKSINPIFLQPFFGFPSNNNKVLQILYPLFSVLLIAYTARKLLDKEKVRKYIGPIAQKISLAITKLHKTTFIIVNTIFIITPFVLTGLFFTSLFRTICNQKNFEDKWENTSKYSKVNDFLYFLGAGLTMLSIFTPFYSLIVNVQTPDLTISGEKFTFTDVTLCVSASLLALALIMSLISMVAPSLTEPSSYIEESKTESKDQKITKKE